MLSFAIQLTLLITSHLYLQATAATWVVIATDKYCDASLRKNLPDQTVSQCQATALVDSDCKPFVYTGVGGGDVSCRCLRQGNTCDFKNAGDSTKVYEYQWECFTAGGTGCASCVGQALRSSDTTCATCNPGYYKSSGSACLPWACFTAGGAGCASCVGQALRISDTTCATCNGGYYESGNACQAWGCTTASGPGCASCVGQALRSSATTCATCNSGYSESGGACQTWGCTTANGAGCASCVGQALRSSATTCATCNSGYYESGGACQAWGCTTANGAGCASCVAPALRSSDTTCATCNSGYYELGGACQAWGCTTANGAGCASCVGQALRSSDMTCATCNSGYYESGGACQAWGCTTANGAGCASCVTPALRSSDTTCATCNSGYYESGGACEAWTTSSSAPTGTTLASGLVECMVTMDITNVDEFLEESELDTVIQEAIGELLGVIPSWIENIRFIRLRRLALRNFLDGVRAEPSNSRGLASDFDMTTSGGVRIEFDVVIPPDGGPGAITASLLMEEFDKKSIEEASDIVNKVVKSGALGSKDYAVTVSVKKGKIEQERHTTIAPTAADDAEFPMMFLAIAVMGGSVCLLMTLLLIMWRLRKIRMKRAAFEEKISLMTFNENTPLCEEQLLFPPDSIPADAKEQVLKNILSVMDDNDPTVFVCFAIGDSDEDLGGHGLFYAGAVVQALTRHGISCYASLPKVNGDPTDFVLCECFPIKLFVLLETRRVYSCRNCLRQIHSAKSNGIDITRLKFEEWKESLDMEDQWSNIRYDDTTSLEMREVVRNTMLTARLVPDFPDHVQSVPGFLESFVLDLGKRFDCELYEPTLMNKSKIDSSCRVEHQERISSKSDESKETKASSKGETDGNKKEASEKEGRERKKERDTQVRSRHKSEDARRKTKDAEIKHAVSENRMTKRSRSEPIAKKYSRARSDRSLDRDRDRDRGRDRDRDRRSDSKEKPTRSSSEKSSGKSKSVF